MSPLSERSFCQWSVTTIGERLASFKVPSMVRVTDARLPRNAAGKVLKRELRDEVAPPR